MTSEEESPVAQPLQEWGLTPPILQNVFNTTSRHDSVSLEDYFIKLNHEAGVFNLENYETQKVDNQFYSNNKKLPFLIVFKPESLLDGVSRVDRLEANLNPMGPISFEMIERDGIDYYYFFKGRQSMMHPPNEMGGTDGADYYLILDFLGVLAKTLNWTTFPKSLLP